MFLVLQLINFIVILSCISNLCHFQLENLSVSIIEYILDKVNVVQLSNSYTLGLSARSILIGRVNLPRGVCGSGGYSGGYPHVDSEFILMTYKFLEHHRSS
jgi:hypothetical protein